MWDVNPTGIYAVKVCEEDIFVFFKWELITSIYWQIYHCPTELK
jgi:hypothetical protein